MERVELQSAAGHSGGERAHRLKVKRERNDEKNRGQPRVEAEELHARVAGNEQQRDDDADAQVREEEEEDGGQGHGLVGQVGRARRSCSRAHTSLDCLNRSARLASSTL